MKKAIDLAKKIKNDLEKDWRDDLEDTGIHDILNPVYGLKNANIEDCNIIICYIIYAYSPDSLWLDVKQDRIHNKVKILKNLNADIDKKIFKEIIDNSNDVVGMCIFNYLEELKNWKWKSIFDLLEYSARMSRFATTETEEEKTYDKMNKSGEIHSLSSEYSIDVIAKVNKEKGLLLEQSIAKRRQADILLDEIRKEFGATTDPATEADFGFHFTETARKREILSWRDFITEKNKRKLLST